MPSQTSLKVNTEGELLNWEPRKQLAARFLCLNSPLSASTKLTCLSIYLFLWRGLYRSNIQMSTYANKGTRSTRLSKASNNWPYGAIPGHFQNADTMLHTIRHSMCSSSVVHNPIKDADSCKIFSAFEEPFLIVNMIIDYFKR